MSLASKSKLSNLHKRSKIIRKIRHFFELRDVLEVDTPLLGQSSASDPHIHSIKAKAFYLQTSPEFAMKKLLAADSGPIFQICKAFRDDEAGRLHSPEFTMLEWYRPGFNHHDLMDEMDLLFNEILQTQASKRLTYQDVFQQHLKIDPLRATLDDLAMCAAEHGLNTVNIDDTDTWLDLLFSHCIQPHLGNDQPYFIYDFPASQAALSRIRTDNPPVAERFELFINGLELANGYHELTNPAEHEQRFITDNQKRKAMGLPEIPIDEELIAALRTGLPACAGVAVGIDRVVMLACEANSLAEVMC